MSESKYVERIRGSVNVIRGLYEEGKQAGLPSEAIRPIAMAYMNMAQAVMAVKGYGQSVGKTAEVKRNKPVLRVVK